MPFARIDLIKGKTAEYRAAVADVVYKGIVDVLKAPEGDRFIVIGEHSPDNFIYDPNFLGWDRSPDFILIQVTSTVGNNKESKLAFFRYIADELESKLSVRPDDVIARLFRDRAARFGQTHLDALWHVFHQGKMYNGFDATEVGSHGARKCAIEVAS